MHEDRQWGHGKATPNQHQNHLQNSIEIAVAEQDSNQGTKREPTKNRPRTSSEPSGNKRRNQHHPAGHKA
jgi:hypothetical protein